MHIGRAAFLGLSLLSLLSGCGDCWGTSVGTDCQVAGDIAEELSSGTTYDNHLSGLGTSCPTVSYGIPYGEPASSQSDLVIDMTFDVRGTGDAPPDVFPIAVNLTIHDVPLGPSEIDFDQTRATLENWPELQGHLSITALSQDCSHGAYYCLVALDGTLSASARHDGATLTLNGVTVSARGTYLRIKEMCAVIGE